MSGTLGAISSGTYAKSTTICKDLIAGIEKKDSNRTLLYRIFLVATFCLAVVAVATAIAGMVLVSPYGLLTAKAMIILYATLGVGGLGFATGVGMIAMRIITANNRKLVREYGLLTKDVSAQTLFREGAKTKANDQYLESKYPALLKKLRKEKHVKLTRVWLNLDVERTSGLLVQILWSINSLIVNADSTTSPGLARLKIVTDLKLRVIKTEFEQLQVELKSLKENAKKNLEKMEKQIDFSINSEEFDESVARINVIKLRLSAVRDLLDTRVDNIKWDS